MNSGELKLVETIPRQSKLANVASFLARVLWGGQPRQESQAPKKDFITLPDQWLIDNFAISPPIKHIEDADRWLAGQ